MPRVIVHLDADAFFASVEQAADPRLRGKPIAVGGERRGIIASASYEARKFGVYTPMPTARARKLCPKLVVLSGDFERYEQFSRWMFGYCYDFTPDVEQTSIDEGYFDLTANHQQPAADIARTIRRIIGQSLKISVSEGLGVNKLISQIASKLHKPAAFTEVPAGQEIPFLHPLPNRWLPGVGPKTSARLNSAGLAEIRHVAATPVDLLELLLGSQAPQLRQFANGVDDRVLIPAREPQKSFSQQETFAEDLTDEGYAEAVLRRMADRLFAKVREEGHSIRTLTLKVRYNDMTEDQCSESLREPSDLETDIYGRLHVMLPRAWKRRVSLRMVSLKLANVYNGIFRSELSLDRDAEQHGARERLARVVDELRRVKGATVLLRGHDFRLKEKPVEAVAADALGEILEGASSTFSVKPKVASDSQTLPHPGPLPLGEGESSAGSWGHLNLSLQDARWKNRDARLLSPLTAVVGQGEGESFLVQATDGSESETPLISKKNHSTIRVPSSFILHPPSLAHVPLRVHSYYSFLDSTLSPKDLVALAARHDCPVVALTDTGNLHGAVEFAEAAKAAGIKPIFGAELRVGASPLLLYVQNARGYHNLCRLLSRHGAAGNDESVAAQQAAPIARQILEPLTDGLIAVSSDLSLATLFPDRFYQPAATRLATDRVRAVACPTVYYATPADRTRFDIVQSIRTRTLLRQAHPQKRLGGRFHFRTPAELTAGCQAHPEWLAHAREIAERCQFDFPFGQPQFPTFPTPDGSSTKELLRRLVMEGLRRRYRNRTIHSDTGAIVPLVTVQAQIETELAIIAEVGYEDLFLITWDLLQTCRARGIEWITRGSAADSLVCYCLGISDVCPIRFGLYFRRFLNKERMALHKLPDIDVDFPHDRKDDVVNILFGKYGPDHCAVVGGFSTFQARSAVADVAKVLGVSEFQIRRFTERFPWSFGSGWIAVDEIRLRGAQLLEKLKLSPECRDLPLDEEPFRTAVETAAFLDGFPRHPKMHPCGVVLSRQPIAELTPTFISNKGWPTTHLDMDAVEAVGLVKMDILAQGGLAVMRDARTALAQRGVEVDLNCCITVEGKLTGEQVRKWESGNGSLSACSTLSVKPKVAGDSTTLPHPGPLPLGEGESPSGYESHLSRSRHDGCRTKSDVQGLFPLPAGEGQGEGESLSVQPPADSSFTDPAVWEMISQGHARAVHHIESPAMVSLCRMCNVQEIDGLIAIVSVIRPGAANEQKKLKFTRRYQKMEPPEYPHPSLEACLRSTFGLVVYEEHILQICEAFAGLSPGRADVLRRALVKQKHREIEIIGREFAAAARARGHPEAKIQEVWELVTGFSGYAFCKAHSTAYGVEAYQAAWLKRYYPAEFMAAVLTNGKGFYHPIVYVLECHRLGIPLSSPSVNAPGPGFVVEGAALWSAATRRCFAGLADLSARQRRVERRAEISEPTAHSSNVRLTTFDGDKSPHSKGFAKNEEVAIRVPLTRAKGLTERTKERILAERARAPFTALADFYRRVGPTAEEMEIIIRVGALDEFGPPRTRQFWEFQHLRQRFGQSADGQGWLLSPPGLEQLPQDLLIEPTRRQRLQWEVEYFDFAVSGHPLDLHDNVAWDTYCPVARLGEHVGERVVACGLIVEQRTHHQVTGEPMKFLSIADRTGIVETELFAATYKSYGLATVRYPVLEIEATVEPFENGRGFSLRVHRAGKPRMIAVQTPCSTEISAERSDAT